MTSTAPPCWLKYPILIGARLASAAPDPPMYAGEVGDLAGVVGWGGCFGWCGLGVGWCSLGVGWCSLGVGWCGLGGDWCRRAAGVGRSCGTLVVVAATTGGDERRCQKYSTEPPT